ncbi:DNA cytosine methyltransferase [Pseudomonas simiae]|uniref:DNA cytosine methyltransferase n=1 Tax=Pseudomonas simiae TaxID=321846 RepID=UPI00273268C1|nr:DNA cytosine methyltransferase [Pseudomonas simiae]WLH16589.1 DNA cytosine methyltransferase [Pseudomonas simiae]
MPDITYGSVCSGIEAATQAWHPLGMKAAWFAEIEPFPSAVLAHHYPDVPNYGDMTKLSAQVLAGKIVAPDVLVGGTPCQAFSVAGMREGLTDPRGALTIKYVELADAVDYVRAGQRKPASVVVWENVPGVLSDKGNAFGCFLGALAGEDCELQPPGKKWQDAGCVYGPKRTIAWRVLDAQYFGLAQRRRRVFVVASARDGFDPTEVLFEREGVRRDTAPRRGEGQDVAGTIAGGARKNGGYSADDIPHVTGPLTTNPYGDHESRESILVFGGNNTSGALEVAPARNACASASGRMDFESEAFVVHGTQDPCVSIDQAHALGRNNGMENAVLAFSCKDHGADAGVIAPTLRAMNHSGSHANAGGQVAVCITGDITHALKAEGFDGSEDGTGRGQPIVAFTQNSRSEVRHIGGDGQIVGALAAEAGAQQQNYLYCREVAQTVTSNYGKQLDNTNSALGPNIVAGLSPTLRSGNMRNNSNPMTEASMLVGGSAVRRLTPVECERLQGMADDYTLIPWRGKPASECPDGPRYKAIGNSKAVTVVRWIGRRLLAQLGNR